MPLTYIDEEEFMKLFNINFSLKFFDHTASESRPGKHWMPYIQQAILVKHFIWSVRTDDWKLDIYSVREMIPHFHVAGHWHQKCSVGSSQTSHCVAMAR